MREINETTFDEASLDNLEYLQVLVLLKNILWIILKINSNILYTIQIYPWIFFAVKFGRR